VPVAGCLDGEALTGEAGGEGLAVRLFVVHHENEGAVVPRRAGQRRAACGRRCVRDSHDQAASFGVRCVKGRRRTSGDDGGWGVDRTDVAWVRGYRALVTNDPRRPARCAPG
jgi:hypothetical protein